MIIFPAIDLIGGKCVRLTAGDFNQMKEYTAEPLEMAMRFEGAGLTHLHLVDLDGARNKKVTQHQILEQICSNTNLIVDFGGGIKTKEDLKLVYDCGAYQANIGSLAVAQAETFEAWLEEFGSDKLIWAADVRDMKLAAHAWKDTSDLHLFDMVDRFIAHGLIYLTCTDISKDGQLTGVNEALYQLLIEKYPGLKITASGGVHKLEDLHRLEAINCYGAIVGKAIYENKIEIETLGSFSRQ